MHPKTDVFCSGSLILPDKGARQINVGGWSLDSTYGIRLYTPDGTPGVNGTNDWEENYQELSLQVSFCDWLAGSHNNPVVGRSLVSYCGTVVEREHSRYWWRDR